MSKKEYKPGDKITIKVGGKEYETIIDRCGVQRFIADPVIEKQFELNRLDLNKLAIEYHEGKLNFDWYLQLHMNLGYSVCGFADLSSFEHLEIENPVWNEK